MVETEEQKIKSIAELRTLIEKRLQEMEIELKGLRVLLDFIDATLLEKGFKRAGIEQQLPSVSRVQTPLSPSSSPAVDVEHGIPLKTVTGEPLANLYVGENVMRVVPADNKDFDVNTPPFKAFLVERVLGKMQEKDREAARTGRIMPEMVLSYDLICEGDVIREIIVRNIDPDRSRELKSTIRWTLEKMYEKTENIDS